MGRGGGGSEVGVGDGKNGERQAVREIHGEGRGGGEEGGE